MSTNNEQWALITGATSGIGASFAKRLANQGINLLLTGRRKEVLEDFAERLRSEYHIQTHLILGDLSESATVDQIIDKSKTCKNLQYIINNAGYGAENAFLEDSYESQESMLRVHVDAPARLTHALAPYVSLGKNKKGGIIFVSSIASFVSSPSSVFYCATKAFLNSFASSLALTLYDKKIPVQALCPGFTRTDFHNKLNIPKDRLTNKGPIRWMSSDTVVDISLRKLKVGKIIVVPGFLNKLLVWASRIIPSSIYMPAAVKKKKLFKGE